MAGLSLDRGIGRKIDYALHEYVLPAAVLGVFVIAAALTLIVCGAMIAHLCVWAWSWT